MVIAPDNLLAILLSAMLFYISSFYHGVNDLAVYNASILNNQIYSGDVLFELLQRLLIFFFLKISL